MSNLTIKLLLIAGVVVAALLFTFPLEDRINLGLDLQGGSRILIQVDTESAIAYELDETGKQISNYFDDEGIGHGAIVPSGDRQLELREVDGSNREKVDEILGTYREAWEVQNPQPGFYRMTLSPSSEEAIITNAVEQALLTLNKRVDGLGVTEPNIQKQGSDGDRILVEMPGVSDLDRIKDILKQVALLEWKTISYPPGLPPSAQNGWVPPAGGSEAVLAQFGGVLPDDTELVYEPETGRFWPLKRVPIVSGSDLRNASPGLDPQWGRPIVNFQLTADAGRRFARVTRENIGKVLPIVLTNNDRAEVISAPRINSEIRDSGYIEGNFTNESAQTLSLQLRSGALPAKLSIIQETTVGPSLGRDSIQKGLVSGLAGFVGVMLFMLVYYRLSGVNAVVALAFNVLLVFAGLGLLPILFAGQGQATLTLPGIAGLILTVGMAVDNNVLIFERIREELRRGKVVRAAVDQGFQSAFRTILDCNVTTLVAAFFLYAYGSGPVAGFAVTLTIGLLASMFTAVFVSRQLFELVLSRKRKADSLSI